MLSQPVNTEIKRLFEWVSSAARDKQAHIEWHTRGATGCKLYKAQARDTSWILICRV